MKYISIMNSGINNLKNIVGAVNHLGLRQRLPMIKI